MTFSQKLAVGLCFSLGSVHLGCATQAAQTRAPSPRSSAAHLFELGEQHLAQGHTARAQQYFVAARAHGADRQTVSRQLIHLCITAGQLRAALTHVREELSHRPVDPALNQLGASLSLALGMNENAEQHLTQLREAPRLPAETHLFLGETFEATFPQEAQKHYREYLKQGGSRKLWVHSRLRHIEREGTQ